uniref:UDP-glycosyltransferase 76B1-like n=1 Tax=Erigeron canadensis TaxID=72917 RepID=UPI001CB97D07|nr:UDP-glycosyltransferase 76B1-like [Erigeron canadensis]
MEDATIPTMKSSNTTTTSRRLVLLPLPFQGHINPMLQLANILHSKAAFSITILHTHFNSPNPNNYPHFNFVAIPGVAEDKHSLSDIGNVVRFLYYLNDNCMDAIQVCLERLMLEDEGVLCLITDAQWFATQSVANRLKIPRIVHRTSSVASFLSFAAAPRLLNTGYLQEFFDADMKSETLVPRLEPLKVKDLPKFMTSDPVDVCNMLELMVQGVKGARSVIWNTFKELEELELHTLKQDFPKPHFLIGPFHKYFPASSSSLLAQDQTCISWLDKYPPNSVLYVSFGSLVELEELKFLEMAWGLANSKQPFLWVVRPRSIKGSEWLEPLPHEFLDKVVEGRGHIVKWAPQQEVLAHPAVGGFWTHSGWNSTLESICEGVTMMCSPSFGDQFPNARYVGDVWKIGITLENGFDRGEIEGTIRKVMVDKEGLEMRDKVMKLKKNADHCLKKDGSSCSSVEDLVQHILSI